MISQEHPLRPFFVLFSRFISFILFQIVSYVWVFFLFVYEVEFAIVDSVFAYLSSVRTEAVRPELMLARGRCLLFQVLMVIRTRCLRYAYYPRSEYLFCQSSQGSPGAPTYSTGNRLRPGALGPYLPTYLPVYGFYMRNRAQVKVSSMPAVAMTVAHARGYGNADVPS